MWELPKDSRDGQSKGEDGLRKRFHTVLTTCETTFQDETEAQGQVSGGQDHTLASTSLALYALTSLQAPEDRLRDAHCISSSLFPVWPYWIMSFFCFP